MEDRLTHETVGGPYASQDDATRAIERGGFSQNAADLIVVPGDDGDDDDDDSGKTASRLAALPEPPPAVGDDGEPSEDQAPDAPDAKSDPKSEEVGENDVTNEDQPGDVLGMDPAQETGIFPTTTKPSQLPSGSGPLQSAQSPPGGQALMPGGSALPAMPGSPQFAPGGLQQADVTGLDPVAQQIDSVAALVTQDNPGLDEVVVRRIACATVGRYLAAATTNPALMPTIEDPLANTSPFSLKDTTQQGDQAGTGDGGASQPDNQPTPRHPDPNRGPGSIVGDTAKARMVMRVLPMLAV